MQTQDAPAEILIKFWPWLEANKQRLVIGASVAILLFVVWLYLAAQKQQNLVAAGEAYTAFQLNQPPTSSAKQVAEGYLAITAKYAGTMPAQRAQLQAGAMLFNGGNYADAQKVFENFLAAEGGSALAVYAKFGLAASLEAQGKLNEALSAYRAAANMSPNSSEAVSAKFSQAGILETQGKLTEALSLYQEIIRSPLGGSYSSEAGQRVAALQSKLATSKPASAKP